MYISRFLDVTLFFYVTYEEEAGARAWIGEVLVDIRSIRIA